MRRKRMLIGLVCFAPALPLQLVDFATAGGLGGFWKLVSFVLVLTGAFFVLTEAHRAKREAKSSASKTPET